MIQNLKFCALKDTINKVKKQPIEWERTFAYYISDKGLIFRLYKENNYQATQFKKWAKDLNLQFSNKIK